VAANGGGAASKPAGRGREAGQPEVPASREPIPGALVTVVIVNWNGERLLPDCFEALAKQDLPEGQVDVWMVDNASADGSVALVERDFPWVRVLRNGRNDGFAGGNNVALRQVRTPYVALCNADARPAPDWLRQLLAPLEEDPTLGCTTSKVLFLPRFVPLRLSTPAHRPGGLDPRELGVRIYGVTVDGRDVTDEVLWDRAAYGPEGEGAGRFRWTWPAGELLVPVSADGKAAVTLGLRLAAEAAKDLELRWTADPAAGAPGGSATVRVPADQPEQVTVELPLAGSSQGGGLVDVLNSVGSVVFADGYGADRAYQEVDRGQHERPEDVFAFCGAACAFRTAALREVGVFDDDFFLYYEDTDLAWRLGSAGWRIRYEPGAVVRHMHSASTGEWSPLFVFHVDRNRLLMLTKNARPGLAAREVLRYPLTTASLALREVARARHTRRRPPVRPTLLRLRVIGSYLRLLPSMLGKRRALARLARVDRRRLERWLIVR
jgi:GT2 family glycosyltransferase